MKQNEEIYFWKIYKKGTYRILKENCETLNIANIDIDFAFQLYKNDQSIVLNFKNKFTAFTIDKNSLHTIEYLKEKFNLKYTIYQLAFLSVLLQSEIAFYTDNPFPFNTSDNSLGDIENEYEDVIQLFNFIAIRLKNESLKDFKNITINYSKGIKIESVFVFKEMLDAYINYHEINLSNFEIKKTERLSICSNFSLDKLLEVKKLNQFHIFNDFISSSADNIPEERKNKFIVAFCHLSQIPINQDSEEILIPSNLTEVSKSDANNLRKKLKGEHKIFFSTGN